MERAWLVTKDATRYQCPTTREWFTPLSIQTQEIGDEQFVWVYCSLCDTHCRTRADAAFEPLEPQPHAYTVEQEPAL